MTEWTTLADLGTAAGTLVLAVATFASVRSANRAARAAETSMLESLRPLVLPSRITDPPEKISFGDDHWIKVDGAHGHAEVTDEVVYMAMALRNVGRGLAVLNGWAFRPERITGADVERPDPKEFRRLVRDLYLPPGDLGFWQGALRDPGEEVFTQAAHTITERQAFTIDLLYSDGEGGQRVITRFALFPREDDAWFTAVSRHWNLDRADPR